MTKRVFKIEADGLTAKEPGGIIEVDIFPDESAYMSITEETGNIAVILLSKAKREELKSKL